MKRIVLVTGGARSGKSRYAQERAEDLVGSKCFLATCPPIDAEIDLRIKSHKKERSGKGWQTIEEGLEICEILKRAEYSIYLVDCLTLWINNILYDSEKRGENTREQEFIEKCGDLIKAAVDSGSTVFFVTNEVGMSVVPENKSARHFRDLVGRCNQLIAQAADEVILISCGIPLKLK